MTDALSFLQAFAALALVSALVWFGRRALTRGGLLGRRSERLRVEERIALDLRNALVVVRVQDEGRARRLLLSTSDRGPARLLLELSPTAATPGAPALPAAPSGEP
ncbi:MAG: hypothetical protein JWN48_3392 [Myxococcaceae bacterium]|nr:hypothetical protein [Myxococcaceae bacterium]